MGPLSSHISTRRVLAALVPVALLVVVAATPGLLGSRLSEAASALGGASPGWLWAAVFAFLASIVCTVLSWRSAMGAAGARIGRYDCAARYGVGCLLNSFAPASVGEAARVTLLAQKARGENGFWSISGAAAAVAFVGGLPPGGLLLAPPLAPPAPPLGPAAAIVAGAAGATAAATVLWRRHPDGRLGHFVGAFAALVRRPRAAAAVLGWSVASQAARLCAAAAVAGALSVPHPLLAAFVIMPTLQLATLLPLAPGNIGVATGAVALALQTRGVASSQALATGLAYHAA